MPLGEAGTPSWPHLLWRHQPPIPLCAKTDTPPPLYIERRYCPPTSNSAWVICPREHTRTASISSAAGKIICMSSVHEVIPWSGHANYAASKGGVILMMKTMARELAPHRIRVNSIGPGAIRIPINTAAWRTPEAYQALMKLVPYRRIGEPDDIAQAAVWLASHAADYVNGTTLFVDGGMMRYPGFAEGG